MRHILAQFRGSLSGAHLFCLSMYSLFITFFFVHEAAKIVSFELTDLSTLYISEATAWGIDVSSRVTWMYRLVIGTALLIVIIFFLLKRLLKNCGDGLIKHEDLLLLSLSGTVLCVMRLFGTDSTHIISSLFFLFIFKLLLVILYYNKIRVSKYLLHPGIFNLSVSFAFLLLFACVFLFGTSSIVHKNYSTILFIGTLFLMFYYFIIRQVFKIGSRKATSYLLPLAGIPFLAFLSVEQFFYKKLIHGHISNYHHNFIQLFVFFTILVAVLLFISRKKRASSYKQYKRYVIPSLLFCYVVITAYTPVIENIPDMFEPANVMSSVMRVFEFGQIPFLDFMSSHMFSEQWYAYLYSCIFGFHNDLSSLSYGGLNSIIFVYVQYVFLSHIFKRETYAIAFIFLFPFVNEVFFTTVLMSLLPFFLTKDLFQKPTAFKVVKLLITCCLLLIWRVDTGVVAIIGNAFFLPLVYFIYAEKFPFKLLLKGLGYFLIVATGIFGIACLLRGYDSVFDSIQLFYHYIAGSQSHGHRSLFDHDVQQFYLYHVLYPILAVLMCLFALYLLKTKYNAKIFDKGYLLLAALYLFIMYLVHLQRGLVRHGFPEINDDYISSVFHVSSALFIAFLFSNVLPIQRYTVFYCSTFILFLLIKYFPLTISKIPLEQGFTEKRFYNEKDPFGHSSIKGRVEIDSSFAANNYTSVKQLMDKHLSEEQTFFDFSNTSMLYFYCNRSIPGYFNQNLQNSIDDVLQIKLLNELDPEKVPVVVYSSFPRGANDAMDDIPNVMRHYLLAEYIFKNYKPFGIFNNKSVWVTPKLASKIKDSVIVDPDSYKPQNYAYKFAAEYIGYYYSKKNTSDLEAIFKIEAKNFTETEHSFSFALPKEISDHSHCYLCIEFKGSENNRKPYPINVQLLNDSSQVTGSFTFERRDKVSNRYMLRLSNHYLWHITNTSAIQVSKDKEIISIEILKDKRFEH